jgi:hypothetical protein
MFSYFTNLRGSISVGEMDFLCSYLKIIKAYQSKTQGKINKESGKFRVKPLSLSLSLSSLALKGGGRLFLFDR